ncbi:MAG: NAD(P)/FAD-dependent oxidoreductase [Gemmatimonadota bacterium]|nr:NAD(P)/FAD-dependent oxidoreductase [Gemmatimonadota bacterium]
MSHSYDAVVVGAGPNGLAAAITLARAGRRVLVREAAMIVGGGLRSAELTLPGFTHDVCAAVHPMAVASPFFRSLPLADHGLEWVYSPAPLAHPFDDGSAALLERTASATGATLGADARAYESLVQPFVKHWSALMTDVLAPLRIPHHPLLLARFGWHGIRSSDRLARGRFKGERARALFGGIAAHAGLRLTASPTAAFALTLAIAGHAVGWPIAQGGSQRIADALASYLRSLGGEIVTEAPVTSLRELPSARDVLLDLTPRQALALEGTGWSSSYRAALTHYRYGPGVFKVDWALAEPIPWKAAECSRAATVHLGGTLDEIRVAEESSWRNETAAAPFVLLGQPTLFDPTRAPSGQHTAWAYCHVPNGSTVDMTDRIERQVERFAPGFRERILARAVMSPGALEAHNANLVGGDISGGAMDLRQLFFRPTIRRIPYATSRDDVWFCSASTPPGGAVHGMCGMHAANAVLRRG